MTRTKRQHYVPQAYLRHFADTDNRLVVYDRTSGRTWKTHVKNAGVENDLYTVTDDTGGASDRYERGTIQWFDDGLARVLPVLLDDQAPITTAHRLFISMYLVFQHLRTPYMRKVAENLTDLMIRSELANLGESYDAEIVDQYLQDSFVASSEPERELVHRIAQDLSLPLVVETEPWLRAIFHLSAKRAEVLETRAWGLVDIPEDGALLTSDSPVTLEGPSLLHIGAASTVAWPIAPRRLLLLGPRGSYDGRSFKRHQVTAKHATVVNQRVAGAALRYLFWHPETDPEKDLVLPVGSHVESLNDLEVQPGERYFDAFWKGRKASPM